jgi:NitT/TauT family transport system substrate-binding protein
LRRASVLLVLCPLLAGGCAGGGERPPGGARRVSVLARSHLSIAPLLLAEAEGFFRDEGLEIDRVSLAASRDGLPALIQGDLDVLTGSVGLAYLNAIAQGARLRVVADKGHLGRDGCTYLALLARPELVRDGVLLRPEGRPRWRFSFARGTVYELLIDRALASAGLSWDDIETVHLTGDTELQALDQGRIDVSMNTGPPMHRQVEAGRATVWRAAQDLLPDGQFSVLLFGPSLLEGDPETGVRFMTAYLRGVRQYNLGKTERNLETLESLTGFDRGTLQATCWIPMRDDGRVDLASLGALQGWAAAQGLLDRELAESEYWEPRFVAEAARRLAARQSAGTEPGRRSEGGSR